MVGFLNLLRLGVRQHPEDLIIVFFLLRSLHAPATLPRTARTDQTRESSSSSLLSLQVLEGP